MHIVELKIQIVAKMHIVELKILHMHGFLRESMHIVGGGGGGIELKILHMRGFLPLFLPANICTIIYSLVIRRMIHTGR